MVAILAVTWPNWVVANDGQITPYMPQNDSLQSITVPIEVETAILTIPPTARFTSTSTDSIKELVLRAFPDAPIMVKVAEAESQFSIYAKNPNSTAYSVFQILDSSYRSYGCTYPRGIVENEIACGRKMYDESGLQPWTSSEYMWGKE